MGWPDFIEEPPETMDIYSNPGTKVIFEYPDNGRTFEQEQALNLLEVGKTYTVRNIKVYPSSSEVQFEEVRGAYFNTVLFKSLDSN